MNLWLILTQFVFRLIFGVALAMAVTPARLVTSGFFRIHSWMLMGFGAFTALAAYSNWESFAKSSTSAPAVFWLAVSGALLSYVGSVIWIYEGALAGKVCLWLVALGGLASAVLASELASEAGGLALGLALLDVTTSGLLVGASLTAMLLGHWYLNTPTMKLAPLKRLLVLVFLALAARAAVSGTGLGLDVASAQSTAATAWAFVILRWAAGMLGTLVLVWLTWLTLKIPNTQSATGILYAAVILVLIGELTSQLLSAQSAFPL